MKSNISKYRVSFFRVEAFDELIPQEAPFGFLSNTDRYEQAFTQAQSGKGPWVLPEHSGHFWYYYLHSRRIEQANPKTVSYRLVPVFSPSIVKKIYTLDEEIRVSINGYCWPHGLGVVLTLFVEKDQTMDAVVRQAFELRYSPVYFLTRNSSKKMNLGNLLDYAMQKYREKALGSLDIHGSCGDIFSVLTFIDGSGVDYSQPTVKNGELYKSLYGLSSWNRAWDKADLSNMDCEIKPIKNEENKAHYVIYTRRGRSVWLPCYFNQPNVRTAGCYHNNLTTLSLQVEGLGALVKLASPKFDDKKGRKVPATFEEYSRNAAVHLSLLYGGNRDTYMSASANKQIKDNDLVLPINIVRDHFGLHPDLE